MNLFVQMTPEEYEGFKLFKRDKKLSDYPISELAGSLLTAIKEQGGQVAVSDDRYSFDPNDRKTTTSGRIRAENFIVSITIDRY